MLLLFDEQLLPPRLCAGARRRSLKSMKFDKFRRLAGTAIRGKLTSVGVDAHHR